MLTFALYLTIAMVTLAALLNVYRLIKGPDAPDRVLALEELFRGTIDGAAVYPREVVKRALELEASALILVHNHPSGDPSPSRADIDMTRRIIEACRPMALAVHDHVIVGKDRVASFHEMGLLDD